MYHKVKVSVKCLNSNPKDWYNDHEICESLLLMESAEIVLINPLYPPFLGDIIAGGHPQTPGRKYPAPLFQRSLTVHSGIQ
jgi:hypothetical protein